MVEISTSSRKRTGVRQDSELRRDRGLDLGAKTKQAGLGRHKLVAELRPPDRMGEVAGRDHAIPLRAAQ